MGARATAKSRTTVKGLLREIGRVEMSGPPFSLNILSLAGVRSLSLWIPTTRQHSTASYLQ